MSVRTLRRHIADPKNPLPTHHVTTAGKGRGLVLVSRREFDAWVERFPPLGEKPPTATKGRSVQERIKKALQEREL
jgi:hypothetical protein